MVKEGATVKKVAPVKMEREGTISYGYKKRSQVLMAMHSCENGKGKLNR